MVPIFGATLYMFSHVIMRRLNAVSNVRICNVTCQQVLRLRVAEFLFCLLRRTHRGNLGAYWDLGVVKSIKWVRAEPPPPLVNFLSICSFWGVSEI